MVVNSYRRPLKLVIRCLEAILNQPKLPKKIILIDQNIAPIALPIDVASHPKIEIQKTKEQSVSGARNSVQLPHDTEWVCFCDDDGYWAKDFSEILQRLEHSNLDVIAGAVMREDTMDYYSLRHKFGGDLSKFTHQKLLMGSNFVVRKELFEKVGRFDSRFGVGALWGSSEETDFAWKCFFAGAKMSFQPSLRIIHVPPFNESFRLGMRKSLRYAVGKGALVAKWLIEEKKPTVLAELFEMLVIPPIQVLRGLLTLKFSLALNNFGVWSGRVVGLCMFPLSKIFKRDE